MPSIAGVAVLGLAGCAGGTTSAAPEATVTVTAEATPTATVTVEPTPAETTKAPAETPTKQAKPADEPTEDAKADQSATFSVPDGVGMDYQSAQDLWRSKGLVVLPAEDATGANRLPFLDSNWVVLGQTPAAGTQAQDGDTITALVKKYTDD
jgi:hypothetical protein